MRRRPVAALCAAGGLAIVLALAAGPLGLGASPEFGLKSAALFIVGADLLIAALVLDGLRPNASRRTETGSVALLGSAVADAVVAYAVTATGLIVLFGQSKPIERTGYFAAALVVVPLSVALAWRRDRIGVDGGRTELTAFGALVLTGATVCLIRVSSLSTSPGVGASVVLLAAVVLARALATVAGWRASPSMLARPSVRLLPAMTPLVLLALVVPFVPADTFSLGDLAGAVVVGLVAYWCALHDIGRRIELGKWSVAVDVVVVVSCWLLAAYVALPAIEFALNQNYFLGPALDIMHGHPMLVGTFSQYGIVMMDALAAIFSVLPLGYGTFTLLLAVLTALYFTTFYVVVRLSTRSRLLAATALGLVVTLCVFGVIGFDPEYPSTGVLRFGIPWLVLLFSQAGARGGSRARLWNWLVLATVAVAAVWSGEAGVYTLVTAGAVAGVEESEHGSLRARTVRFGRRAVMLVATSVGALVSFTVLTRVLAGSWPDWGAYLYYVRLYTTAGFGNEPIAAWSPGLALGGFYTVSATITILLLVRRPQVVPRLTEFRAVAGLTALGVAVFTYFLGRADPNNLFHISPPAVALLFVWVAIVRSS